MIEVHRISWLIWIQILVFLLLLLFCFSFFPADLPDTTTTSSSASPSTPGVFMPLNFHSENQILDQNDHHVSNRLQHTQVHMQSLSLSLFYILVFSERIFKPCLVKCNSFLLGLETTWTLRYLFLLLFWVFICLFGGLIFSFLDFSLLVSKVLHGVDFSSPLFTDSYTLQDRPDFVKNN